VKGEAMPAGVPPPRPYLLRGQGELRQKKKKKQQPRGRKGTLSTEAGGPSTQHMQQRSLVVPSPSGVWVRAACLQG